MGLWCGRVLEGMKGTEEDEGGDEEDEELEMF